MKRAVGLKIIGFIVLAWVLTRVDLTGVWSALKAARFGWLIGGAMLLLLSFLVKIFRWRRILAAQGVYESFPRIFQYSFAAFFLALITPGRVGEMAKAGFVRRPEGITLGSLITGAVLDRLFDLWILAVTAACGVATLVATKSTTAAVLITGAVAAVAPFLMAATPFRRRLIHAVDAIHRRQGLAASLAEKVLSFLSEFIKLTRRILLPGILATLVASALFFSGCLLLSFSLNLEIGFIRLSAYISMAAMLSFLPVTVAGLGTREACLIYFFTLEGIPSEGALAFSGLYFAATYLLLGLIGFGCLMIMGGYKKGRAKALEGERA